MIKFVILCLLVIIALALLAGPGVRRIIARILGLPHK
jgi:hypothetical protein